MRCNNAQEIELYGRKCVGGAAIQLSGSLGEKGARYLTDLVNPLPRVVVRVVPETGMLAE